MFDLRGVLAYFFSKNKKGAEINEIAKILIAVVVLVIMVAGAYYFIKVKGGFSLEFLRRILHLGKGA